MKFNRSEIMRNAWTIRRESGYTMSAALKKAWAVAKKGIEMSKKDGIIAKLNKIVAMGNAPPERLPLRTDRQRLGEVRQEPHIF